MDELSRALRELAGAAQPPAPADPAALWSRGRARVRNRRVRVAAVALLAVVIGYVGIARPEPSVVMPAGEPHAPAIPTNVYAPNRFLAGVSEEGPPGQLAVIGQVEDGDTEDGAEASWFGISATTGAYVKLDLPKLSSDGIGMALSPDGNRIAYWVTGPTRRKDYGPPTERSEGGPLPEHPTTGVGVYDLRTGSLVQHQELSDFGLDTDTFNGPVLSWLASDALLFSFGVRVSPNETNDGQTYRWGPLSSAPEARGTAEYAEPSPALPGSGAVWSVEPGALGGRYALIDDQARPAGRDFRVPATNLVRELSLYGDRVLATGQLHTITTNGDSSDGVRRVLTGPLPANGAAADLHVVRGIAQAEFLGWSSPTSALFRARPYTDEDDFDRLQDAQPGLFSVDLATEQVRRLGSIDPTLQDDTIQVATELLDDPYVHGRKPPSLVSALRVPIGIGVVLLIGAGLYLWYRRRPWRQYLAREKARSVA